MPESVRVDESLFSNEELAIALLSPNQLYSPHTIRLGAAMLGAPGNSPLIIAELALGEGAGIPVRYIAKAAAQFEPENPFWDELLQKLSDTVEPPDGVLPHPTRFVSMTGFTRNGAGRIVVWIRPRKDLAIVHG